MSAGPTAQPSRTPGKNVFDVVPVCTTTSGARLQRLGSDSPAEAELAVRDVLDDQEPVAVRQLGQQHSPLGREADAGRVLMVRDAVDDLWPEPTCETPLQVVYVEPVLVHADGDQRCLEAPERLDRAEVRGGFDDDQVAGVDERLADELECLDRAARDQELVVRGTTPLQRLEPAREGVEEPGEAARRCVLERGRLLRGCQLLEQRRDALARKCLRVGEPTRERDQVGDSEEGQDGCDPVADVTPRARSDQRVPPTDLGCRRHASHPRRRLSNRRTASYKGGVFVTVTTTRGSPDEPLESATIAGEEMLPWLRQIDGFEGLLMVSNETEGRTS